MKIVLSSRAVLPETFVLSTPLQGYYPPSFPYENYNLHELEIFNFLAEIREN